MLNYTCTRTHTHTHIVHIQIYALWVSIRLSAHPSMHSSIYYLNALLYTVHTHIHIEKILDLDTLCFHHCAALAANPCSAWLRLSNCVTAIQDGLDATLLDSTWLFKAIRVDTWQNMEKLRYISYTLFISVYSGQAANILMQSNARDCGWRVCNDY